MDFPFPTLSHEISCFFRCLGNGFSVPMHHSISILLCFTIRFTPQTQRIIEPRFEFSFYFFLHLCLNGQFETCFNILRLHLHCFSLPIMEELHHLDLLINFQSEAFKEMLEDHVSIFFCPVLICGFTF